MRAVTQILTKAVKTPAKVRLQQRSRDHLRITLAFSQNLSNEFFINGKYYYKAVSIKIAKRNYSSEVSN